jgi:hypothetical protein
MGLINMSGRGPKLRLYSAKGLEKTRPKATVHLSGKLGFNRSAANQLGLENGSGLLLFIDDNSDNLTLYLQILPEANQDSFKVVRAGRYFYAPTRPFFDAIKLDYSSHTVIYDLQRVDVDGEFYFKMSGRITKGRRRPEDELTSIEESEFEEISDESPPRDE